MAIIFAFQGNLISGSLCIFLGAFLDFFDGLAARLLKINGEFGKQLDSIADMLTFGVAPGFILFHFMFYLNHNILFHEHKAENIFFYPEILAFLIPIFSALRLANFNIDIKQTDSFIGLPTPALAIFIAALPHVDFDRFPMFADIQLITILAIIMPILLLVKINLFSLKFSADQNIYSKVQVLRICLILAAILLFFIFQFAAVPFIVILYLILSLLNNIF